jgi:hypothetical protein
MLRQKGVFPSPPMPPHTEPTPVSTIAPQFTPLQSAPVAVSQPSERISSPSQRKEPEVVPASENARQDLSGLYKFAAIEFANKRSPQTIIKSMTHRGVASETAKKIVIETQQAINKVKSEGSRKRMVRGLIWTVLGIVVTCATFLFSDSLGGRYVLFWGAIIFGVIDFLVGLFGWLSNK